MTPPLRIAAICLCGCLIATLPAAGQSTQHPEPGSRARAPEEPREALERQQRDARWTFGKIKVDPRVWVREAGYRSNVFGANDDEEAVDDYTITAGAGLVAFLNLGRKLVARGALEPEYTWWSDLSELRQLNVSGEAELFGLFNKATTQLAWHRTNRQGQLNDELATPVETDNETLFVDGTVELTSRVSVFGRFQATEVRQEDLVSEVPISTVTLLDRDEERVHLGVEYSPRRGLVIGLGIEETEADFLQDPANRSNSSRGPLIRLEVDRNALSIRGDLVSRKVEFDSGTEFDELTGSLSARRTVGSSGLITAYADRELVYSALDGAAYYVDETLGVAGETAFARRFRLQLFAETGENRFRDVQTAAGGARRDDVDSFGATVVFQLGGGVALSFGGQRSNFDSTLDEFDRSTTSFGIDLGLGDELFFRR